MINTKLLFFKPNIMKTTTKSLLLGTAALVTTLILSSCGGAEVQTNLDKDSDKGSWSQADKDKALTELNSSSEEMEELIGSENTKVMFDCALEKMQDKYKNFEGANNDYDGMRVIGRECMEELLATGISSKGNWNSEELMKARTGLNAERGPIDDLVGVEKTNEFIECALERIEQSYPNYAAADVDLKGMEKIGEECMLNVLGVSQN